FDARRFDDATAGRLLGHLETLLTGAAAGTARRLSDLTLLSAAERGQMLVEWTATDRAYGRPHVLHRLIEEQVERTPDAPAVAFAGESLTYRELDARANALAHDLAACGVGPETLVGICAERS